MTTLRERIERGISLEPPIVETVAMQVRTSASVPFVAHMIGADDPRVERVGMQVRTSASVPFADYMKSREVTEAPSVDTVSMQVRTSASVPFANYMLSDKTAKPANRPIPDKK
jgi:hypothetical protein